MDTYSPLKAPPLSPSAERFGTIDVVLTINGRDYRLALDPRMTLLGGEPFDRSDMLALRHGREGQAGKHPLSIDVNGTSSALPLIASLLRAGQAEMLPQSVEEGHPRIEREDGLLPMLRFAISPMTVDSQK